MPTPPEMSAPMLGRYLGRIQLTHAVPALQAIAAEVAREFPTDEATPRLLGMIALKVKRLVGEN